MKRIGLTQRAHAVSGYGERRDMLDQRWAALIERLGACPLPLANNVRDAAACLGTLAPDALVMTGGNDIAALPGAADGAPERDRYEAAAYRYFLQHGRPVLGVCRGAQMINHLAGGRLVRVPGHAGTRHELVWAGQLPEYWDRPAEVNSYHGWAIPADGLAPGMEALAWGRDGTVEAFRSVSGNVNAVVWHPEREPELGPSTFAFLAAVLGL
ncbi:gamma-glutamyl-gamma-aminobutyrate hydrolase family protein [Accumulibacter sp.]|uniref:gamma-glutamyl-gamma-aminobutyrate hydrolase family protein n=1 Tax=Accumulibacter sp. TaxID=2053492 RepID=UPI0025E41E7E|nr:gamma-glutamyl-gamma-aminobutyrate hydrolase family protein [Accumulibacter sp.]MCM8594224.1 gamma-glutamyl-gamma-aminobutyrate hydrolase family protein [Accumulibacter sp.]MCM8625790.1 gamma-glutamyl-gamma-aminobutyrate hydrolase family protein [Accumulibacter sp.]MDS4048367.1 gamma-glutamyl-gamma-aminobutyrate hydrolase family protein [Accumulibacter sp.]